MWKSVKGYECFLKALYWGVTEAVYFVYLLHWKRNFWSGQAECKPLYPIALTVCINWRGCGRWHYGKLFIFNRRSEVGSGTIGWCDHGQGTLTWWDQIWGKLNFMQILWHRGTTDQSLLSIASNPYWIGCWHLALPSMLGSTHTRIRLAWWDGIQVLVNRYCQVWAVCQKSWK
jgi:hypothetical protein